MPVAALRAALDRGLAAAAGPVLGVAVSGGGDSVALLRLARDWAVDTGRRLAAITIDHGLRSEAAAEAGAVARLCAAWQIPMRFAAGMTLTAPATSRTAPALRGAG